MRRFRPLIVIVLLVSLVGSWAMWAFAIPAALSHGVHHMSLDSSHGRLAILLEHGVDEFSHHHAHDHDHLTDSAAATSTPHSGDHGRDHIIELPGSSAPCFTTVSQQAPSDGGLATLLLTTTVGTGSRASLASGAARSRVGPPAPSRSSILRI